MTPLYHHPEGLTRMYSRGRVHGYRNEPAACSSCRTRLATWLAKCRFYQRYFCEECVRRTREWQERFGGQP